MTLHNVTWKVSLSDGTNHQEGKGLFEEVKGGNSPWLELLAYLEKNSLQITSLVLVTSDNRTFHLPSRGANPKFRRFDLAEKPIAYRCERTIGMDKNAAGELIDKPDWYTIGVAVYNNYETQLWVDENDTRNCWVLTMPYGK